MSKCAECDKGIGHFLECSQHHDHADLWAPERPDGMKSCVIIDSDVTAPDPVVAERALCRHPYMTSDAVCCYCGQDVSAIADAAWRNLP